MNIYIELTKKFNRGKIRAIISSGQAAVLHHIAIMSKDGDWILKEESAAIKHVLAVLSEYGAKYRFGAPLDTERRELIHLNENRLKKYMTAAEKWLNIWPSVQEDIKELSLTDAHNIVLTRAKGVLPQKISLKF